ncbi:PfpI family intracellular protease [Paenibacillus turicensis]|uniref:PfpI family intracellular protease n=1 Tax=Paenibacillus turicensis TaxID=160487 RepID=A0ABS4FPM9_9BACL|nr:DJ-1/PfpI family protein [Paenibacillus turicensis]MBP1904527.1 PfpI family intracellular protease [Paenibacillus turicensis]
MKKVFITVICLVMSSFMVLGALGSGSINTVSAKEPSEAFTTKKVLMVIAPKDFEDCEVIEPMAILKANGAQVTLASITTDTAIGLNGFKIKPDIKISDAKVDDYDAIVIPGGTGVIGTLWDNEELRTLIQQFNNQNKIVAAMCAAPPALAKAGILKGKTVTMFPWEDGIKELTSRGAIYVNEVTVTDGNIVTAKNPDASTSFGIAICDALKIRKFTKNVLMVVAPKDFEDIELYAPKTLLELNGANVTVASTSSKALGLNGSTYTTDIMIANAKSKDYDAIVIVGGTGVIGTLWEDQDLRSLVKDANKQKKIIAAICAAPPVLARAGILKDKKATMFPWSDGIKELTSNGVKYEDKEVVVSGNIVTGKNPDASVAFGLKLCEALKILGK